MTSFLRSQTLDSGSRSKRSHFCCNSSRCGSIWSSGRSYIDGRWIRIQPDKVHKGRWMADGGCCYHWQRLACFARSWLAPTSATGWEQQVVLRSLACCIRKARLRTIFRFHQQAALQVLVQVAAAALTEIAATAVWTRQGRTCGRRPARTHCRSGRRRRRRQSLQVKLRLSGNLRPSLRRRRLLVGARQLHSQLCQRSQLQRRCRS